MRPSEVYDGNPYTRKTTFVRVEALADAIVWAY